MAEFLLTLAGLSLLAGMLVFIFQVYQHEMWGPTKPQEEARFYREAAPHWRPSDIVSKSIVLNRDDGGIYAELKTAEPFNGTRMTPLDKDARIWRYDVNGRSYAVVIHSPMNAQWVLRSIEK